MLIGVFLQKHGVTTQRKIIHSCFSVISAAHILLETELSKVTKATNMLKFSLNGKISYVPSRWQHTARIIYGATIQTTSVFHIAVKTSIHVTVMKYET
jgi:hypothetical protein